MISASQASTFDVIAAATLFAILAANPIASRAQTPAATSDDDGPLFYESAKLDKDDELKMRRYVSKGGTITVYFDSCKVKGMKFKEVERNTKIHEDLLALAKKAAGLERAEEVCRRKPDSMTYQTKYERSLTTVTALDDAGQELGTRTLVVGPVERLSLGIDLPVSNRKTLKYDSDSKTLLPQDSSPQLYLSFNVSAGDVLAAPDELPWQRRFKMKLFVQASSHPLNSYGVGLGYRIGKISTIDLEGLDLFAGYFNTKEDKIENGSPLPNQATKGSWRVGISYDLGTALKWVKF